MTKQEERQAELVELANMTLAGIEGHELIEKEDMSEEEWDIIKSFQNEEITEEEFYSKLTTSYEERIQDAKNLNQYLSQFTTEEQKAIRKVYDLVCEDIYNVHSDIDAGWLTINKCRNGRSVAWYFDFSREAAVYTDTLEALTEEEIKEQLQ